MESYRKIIRPTILVVIIVALAVFFIRYFNKGAVQKGHETTKLHEKQNIISLKNSFQEEVIKREGPVTVIFSAAWCPSCVNMKEVITTAAVKMPDLPFVMIDVDDFKHLASEYSIQAIPAFLFFDNGKLVSRTSGFMDEAQFTKTIQSTFGMSN